MFYVGWNLYLILKVLFGVNGIKTVSEWSSVGVMGPLGV